MRTKLIAFDLDGTLLHDDKTIAARSLRALQAAHDHGALIVPATGRIPRSTAPRSETSWPSG